MRRSGIHVQGPTVSVILKPRAMFKVTVRYMHVLLVNMYPDHLQRVVEIEVRLGLRGSHFNCDDEFAAVPALSDCHIVGPKVGVIWWWR
jgi:hypothetical protein